MASWHFTDSKNASLTCRLVLSLFLIPAMGMGTSMCEEIVLGMSAAFSGPSRGLGIELYRGSMAYFDELNENGGVHGRRVRIQAYDDRYDPLPAIENTIRLIEQDEVLALFNYVGTPTVTRVLPLLKKYQRDSVLLFFPFTGAQPQRQPPYDAFVYNLRSSYAQETAGLVQLFLERGHTRIGVFYQADAYGRSGWEGVRRALAKQGLSMAAEATYRRGTPFESDLSAQVEILRRAGSEAIISIGAYSACAALIRDSRDSGWEIPIANVSFVGSESLLSELSRAGMAGGRDYTRNLINSQVVPSYEDDSLPAVREYRRLMRRHDPTAPPALGASDYRPLPFSFVSFEGFLNAKLVTRILNLLGPDPDRGAIAAAVDTLAEMDLGIGEAISFGPAKHQGSSRVYYTTVESGRFVPIRAPGTGEMR